MKNTIFPHTFWRPFMDCMRRLFFRSKYVWFPVHLYGPVIPDHSGQLAELIVYITSTRVHLYSHQIFFHCGLLALHGTTDHRRQVMARCCQATKRYIIWLYHYQLFTMILGNYPNWFSDVMLFFAKIYTCMYLISINQSIKSSFVKGAGAHPQKAPCRRCSHDLRSAPVRRGRLLSTVLHR